MDDTEQLLDQIKGNAEALRRCHTGHNPLDPEQRRELVEQVDHIVRILRRRPIYREGLRDADMSHDGTPV